MQHIKSGGEQLVLLSPRETQVLALLVLGLPNKRIAHDLHISPQTVKQHVSTLLEDLNCDNRVQLVVLAMNNPGLLQREAVRLLRRANLELAV